MTRAKPRPKRRSLSPLERLRWKQGLTARDVAKRAGFGWASLRRWETAWDHPRNLGASRSPHAVNAAKLCKLYQITPKEIALMLKDIILDDWLARVELEFEALEKADEAVTRASGRTD